MGTGPAAGPGYDLALTELLDSGGHLTLSDGEPTGLLDTWTGVPLAAVVDAVLCEPPVPGRVWRHAVSGLPGGSAAASSHGLGIPDALLLGRALDRLPGRLVVIAVEAASLGAGLGLSAPVAAALPEAVAAVLADVAVPGRPAEADGGTGDRETAQPRSADRPP